MFRRGSARETQHEREKRANDQRFYALAPLYNDILARASARSARGKEVRVMQEVIKSRFRLSKPTPRMKTFMRWVKGVRDRGKQFIIVCDRIFPLVLAHYVFRSLVVCYLP